MRSPVTGLLGNTFHADTKDWVRTDSGIGAGIDSIYEYMLKVCKSHLESMSSRLQRSSSAIAAPQRLDK